MDLPRDLFVGVPEHGVIVGQGEAYRLDRGIHSKECTQEPSNPKAPRSQFRWLWRLLSIASSF
jgi:hypothetical protein